MATSIRLAGLGAGVVGVVFAWWSMSGAREGSETAAAASAAASSPVVGSSAVRSARLTRDDNDAHCERLFLAQPDAPGGDQAAREIERALDGAPAKASGATYAVVCRSKICRIDTTYTTLDVERSVVNGWLEPGGVLTEALHPTAAHVVRSQRLPRADGSLRGRVYLWREGHPFEGTPRPSE